MTREDRSGISREEGSTHGKLRVRERALRGRSRRRKKRLAEGVHAVNNVQRDQHPRFTPTGKFLPRTMRGGGDTQVKLSTPGQVIII